MFAMVRAFLAAFLRMQNTEGLRTTCPTHGTFLDDDNQCGMCLKKVVYTDPRDRTTPVDDDEAVFIAEEAMLTDLRQVITVRFPLKDLSVLNN